jgi:hypothetical protein
LKAAFADHVEGKGNWEHGGYLGHMAGIVNLIVRSQFAAPRWMKSLAAQN